MSRRLHSLQIGAACLAVASVIGSAGAAGAQTETRPPDSIEVVYHPGTMFYSIEDGGRGRFRVSEREDYSFTTSHEDYIRVAALLKPLRGGGNPCPGQAAPGYIRWTRGAVVQEAPLAVSGCSDPAFLERSRSDNQAFRFVYELAENAPQLGHPPLPAPAQIKLVWMTWGNVREEWIIPAGGTAHWREPGSGERDFAVSQADFNRVRAWFSAFEGVAFRCDRVVYDMPYGRVVWSQPGHPDQTLEFDLGCVTGDADEVLESVEKATADMVSMRDRAA